MPDSLARSEVAQSWVRPIVTYALAGSLVAGFFLGMIPAEVFYTTASNVIMFWFGTRQGEKVAQAQIEAAAAVAVAQQEVARASEPVSNERSKT